MVEIDQLEKHPGKILDYLSDTSREAGGRITSRLLFEEDNLIIRSLPIGGEEGLDSVLAFMPMAKEGFALSLRSEDIGKDQVGDILEITRPQSLSDMASELGITLTPHLVREVPRLSIFKHALATLIVLSVMSSVDSIMVDASVSGVTNWPYKIDKEKIWYLLSEIEDTTRRMIMDRRNINDEKAKLRALHFFAAGRILAEKLR